MSGHTFGCWKPSLALLYLDNDGYRVLALEHHQGIALDNIYPLSWAGGVSGPFVVTRILVFRTDVPIKKLALGSPQTQQTSS